MANSTPTQDPAPETTTTTTTKTLLIGLSGPSSSGKTTLARLLRQLFDFSSVSSDSHSAARPPSRPALSLFILHQDDFYLTDALIPVVTTPVDAPSGLGQRQLQDWDCVESLDVGLLGRTLDFVRENGRVPVRSSTVAGDGVGDGDGDGPEWGESKEDRNSVGPVDLPTGLVDSLRRELEGWWSAVSEERLMDSARLQSPSPTQIRLCILDGFLLYPDPNPDPGPDPDSERDSGSGNGGGTTFNESTNDDDGIAPLTTTTTTTTTTAQTERKATAAAAAAAAAAETTNPKPTLQTAVTDTLDLKLLVLATRAQTIRRRTARTGYVTLEGFWEDPPGYVEDVVWRNWERDGAWLMTKKKKKMKKKKKISGEPEPEPSAGAQMPAQLQLSPPRVKQERGDSDEEDPMVCVDDDVASSNGIRVAPGKGQLALGELLTWAVGEVQGLVEGLGRW